MSRAQIECSRYLRLGDRPDELMAVWVWTADRNGLEQERVHFASVLVLSVIW